MDTGYLHQHLNELEASIFEKLPQIVVEGNKRDIHQLRVAWKRLFALRYIFRNWFPEEDAHSPSATRLFYKALGKVRNYQLARQMTAKYHLDLRIRKSLGKRKKWALNAALQMNIIPIYLEQRNMFFQLHQILFSLDDPTLKGLIRSRLEELLQDIHDGLKKIGENADHLHQLRASFKTLIYALEFLDAHATSSKYFKQIEAWTSLIGQWHDFQMAGKRIRHMEEKKQLGHESSQTLKMLENEKLQEIKNSSEDISKVLPNLLIPFKT